MLFVRCVVAARSQFACPLADVNGVKLGWREHAEKHIVLLLSSTEWPSGDAAAAAAASAGDDPAAAKQKAFKVGKEEKLSPVAQIARLSTRFVKRNTTLTVFVETARLDGFVNDAAKQENFRYFGHPDRDNAYADFTSFSPAHSIRHYQAARETPKAGEPCSILARMLTDAMHCAQTRWCWRFYAKRCGLARTICRGWTSGMWSTTESTPCPCAKVRFSLSSCLGHWKPLSWYHARSEL